MTYSRNENFVKCIIMRDRSERNVKRSTLSPSSLRIVITINFLVSTFSSTIVHRRDTCSSVFSVYYEFFYTRLCVKNPFVQDHTVLHLFQKMTMSTHVLLCMSYLFGMRCIVIHIYSKVFEKKSVRMHTKRIS